MKIFFTTLIKSSLTICLFVILAVNIVQAQNPLNIYGYFSTRYEKTFAEPVISNGKTVDETSPAEWAYPYLNIMMQQSINDNFKFYMNLNGSGAGNISVRNYWAEYSASQYFNLRLGKVYRKFGLYNEILDAVPTYYGIEAPELFDADHLIVSRETALLVYGGLDLGPGTVNYSLSTDNGEGGPFEEVIPVGWDFNYAIGHEYKFGTSGYISGKNALSDVSLGDGSPKNGVLPWMSNDEFSVFGGYANLNFGNLLVQGEFWASSHKAVRDPASVVTFLNEGATVPAQRSRFLKDPNGAVDESNIKTVGDYDISTWYVRSGYSIETNFGEIAPYVQWDYYSNPETIRKKTWGGDNEAGASDDGKFNKSTIGIVYRPINQVAIKLDQSFHFYKLNGEDVKYPEVRFDVSYTFGL